MVFKPRIWYPIAIGLAALNLIAVGFATDDAWHMGAHVGLAVAFGLWARRLGRARDESAEQGAGGNELQDRLEELESEATRVRQELSEAQERLDFTERMLAQRPEPRRVDPKP